MTETRLQLLTDSIVKKISEKTGLAIKPPPLTKDGGCVVSLEGDRELWRSLNGEHQEREARLLFLGKAAESAEAFGIVCNIGDSLGSAEADEFSTETAIVQGFTVSGITGGCQSGDWIAQIDVKIKYSF